MAIKFGRPIEVREVARHQATSQPPALDLTVRPRRNRKAEWARRLVRENVLTTDDLIGLCSWSTATMRAPLSPRCRAWSGCRSTRPCATPSGR